MTQVTVDAPTVCHGKETGPFEERQRFVTACEEANDSFSVICERLGRRQNGYKWLARSRMAGWKACSIGRDAALQFA
jgi:hypothetical protein